MLKALRSLKVDKSPGPDGLHLRILREVAEEIADPLTVLSNATISQDKTKEAWKTAEGNDSLAEG